MIHRYLFSFICIFFSNYLFAATQSGLVITSKGDVKILSSSIKKGPSLLFEGKKYFYRKSKVAQKVYANEILLSGPNGRAKIIYVNGDQFFLGPSSMVSVPEISNTKKKPSIDLIYGKMRAVIHPKKELSGLRIKTKAAVMGVRGTDFIGVHHDSVGTFTTVLRGKVEVKSSFSAKKIVVEKGATGKIAKKRVLATVLPEKNEEAKVEPMKAKEVEDLEIQTTSREEIKDIKKAFLHTEEIVVKDLKVEEKKEVLALNTLAKENLVTELKEIPQVEKKIDEIKEQTVAELNEIDIQQVEVKAPSRKLEWEPKEEIKISNNPSDSTLPKMIWGRVGIGSIAAFSDKAGQRREGEYYSAELSWMPKYEFSSFFIQGNISFSKLANRAEESFTTMELSLDLAYKFSVISPFIKLGTKKYGVLHRESLFGLGFNLPLDRSFMKELYFKINEMNNYLGGKNHELILGVVL